METRTGSSQQQKWTANRFREKMHSWPLRKCGDWLSKCHVTKTFSDCETDTTKHGGEFCRQFEASML